VCVCVRARRGFRGQKNAPKVGEAARVACLSCGVMVTRSLNPSGRWYVYVCVCVCVCVCVYVNVFMLCSSHIGEYHSSYSHCSKLKYDTPLTQHNTTHARTHTHTYTHTNTHSRRCGWHLKSNIGRCHWSCCYALTHDSPCCKSDAHDLPPE